MWTVGHAELNVGRDEERRYIHGQTELKHLVMAKYNSTMKERKLYNIKTTQRMSGVKKKCSDNR